MRDIKETYDKRIKSAYERHQNSRLYELNDCYKNPSTNKFDVFAIHRDIMRQYEGFDFRIISYNTFVFTVGFFGYINNRLNFFYITPDHIRYMEIY